VSPSPRTVACDEHGRLPHLGHVACRACGRIYKHRSDTGSCFCGGNTFAPACAKCAQAQAREHATASAPRAAHASVELYDEGAAGIDFVG
jgi:hypothetical protein